MARIRTIKPGFWKNERLSALPEYVHMLAGALLNYADDEGYFNANERLILAECLPLRDPSIPIPVCLRYLVGIDYLRLGRGRDGRLYGHIVNFTEHQVVNKPKPSEIKALVDVWDNSGIDPVAAPDDYREEWKGMEGEKEWNGEGAPSGAGAQVVEQEQPAAAPPAKPAAVTKSAARRGTRIPANWGPSEDNIREALAMGLSRAQVNATAATFRDYWLGVAGEKGTKLDWDATWRNWCRRDAERLGRRPGGLPDGAGPRPGGGPQAGGAALSPDAQELEPHVREDGVPQLRAPQTDDEWLACLVAFRDRRYWPTWAGPHPLTAQSIVPRHLYAQAGMTAPGAVGVRKPPSLEQQREMAEAIKTGALHLQGPAPGLPGSMISPEVAAEYGIGPQGSVPAVPRAAGGGHG